MADTEKNTTSSEPTVPVGNVKLPAVPAHPVETRFQRLLHGLIRWTLALLVAFLFGVAVVALPLYIPAQMKLEAARNDLKEANQLGEEQTAAFQSLKIDQEELQEKLAAAELRLTVLGALSDVTAARLALTAEAYNYANADFSLSEAIQSLDDAAKLMGGEQSKGVVAMRQLASQALNKLNGADPKSAAADLEKLMDSLITLRRKLFE